MEELHEIRKSIDNIDRAILAMFAERFKLTARVGEMKADAGVDAVDPQREQLQFARIEEEAKELGLDPEFAKTLLRFVIDEVVQNHERLRATVDEG